jgi:hypothetical protein
LELKNIKMENTPATLTKSLLQSLMHETHECSISLYMPTHRSHPENLKDILVFKNLIKQLSQILQEIYPGTDMRQYLKPFDSIIYDKSLWDNTLDGLAIFSAGDYLKIIPLQLPVKSLVMVKNRFYTKPLRLYLQSIDHYHVLVLHLDNFQLFEGNRFMLSEVDLNASIPKTLSEALGEKLTEKHSTVASYGGVGPQNSSMHHGDGGRKDHIDADIEKYFRIISLAIEKNYSKPTGFPLILAALPEQQHLFHKVSKNPLLEKEGIMTDVSSLSIQALADLAWKAMQPHYLRRLSELTQKYELAKSQNRASDDLEQIAKAVAAGKVEVLLLEQNRIIPGKITDKNPVTIFTDSSNEILMGDILDDIALMATEKASDVVVVSKDKMPTQSGLAAIFRYK